MCFPNGVIYSRGAVKTERRQGAYIPCHALSFFSLCIFFPPFCFWLESLVISTNLFGHEQGGRERVKFIMLGFHGPGGKSVRGEKLVSEVSLSREKSRRWLRCPLQLSKSLCENMSARAT